MVYLVYVTASSQEEAKDLAKKAVEARLAACANVYPQITSFYWWEGKLNQDQEASVIFKTWADKVEKLIEHLKEWHSYSCPCVLAWPIEKGNQAFIAWIEQETRS